jgi:hypothetical protein
MFFDAMVPMSIGAAPGRRPGVPQGNAAIFLKRTDQEHNIAALL